MLATYQKQDAGNRMLEPLLSITDLLIGKSIKKMTPGK